MVDAVARTSDEIGPDMAALAVDGPPPLRAACLDGAGALVAYRDHCRTALFAPPQNPLWVECWARHCNDDVIVALLARDGRTVLALALEIVTEGGVVTARFVGGSHANGNFPAISAHLDPAIAVAELTLLTDAIIRARPDIDLIRLERLVDDFEGVVNPLRLLPGLQSPNPSLAVNLSGGFDTVLSRASAKRKKKKHRYQTRKFEAAGGMRRFRATTGAETGRILDDFFAMKALRFATMGIRDVFADPGVPAFFRDLFASALEEARPSFVLDALEVGGKLRAITGNSLTLSSLVCEFGAIAEDELAFASPGEFLFFESIRDACAEGFAVYDFSVGDEPYKRLWCDLETRQTDVMLPFGAKGHAARLLIATTARAKRFVKSNRYLWEGVKRLRRRPQTEPADRDD
jgi:CelD/BcsL family acetyltransferase involved in cellulose biosynthesis